MVANAAIARELAGWCWSLAVLQRLEEGGVEPDPGHLVASVVAHRARAKNTLTMLPANCT